MCTAAGCAHFQLGERVGLSAELRWRTVLSGQPVAAHISPLLEVQRIEDGVLELGVDAEVAVGQRIEEWQGDAVTM